MVGETEMIGEDLEKNICKVQERKTSLSVKRKVRY
jgi:hypothetical protein